MSKPLKKILVNGNAHDIIGRPRCFCLSANGDLVEYKSIKFNSNTKNLELEGSAYQQNYSADPTEIAAILALNHNRLYKFSNNIYNSCADFYHSGYATAHAVAIHQATCYEGSGFSFYKLHYIP